MDHRFPNSQSEPVVMGFPSAKHVQDLRSPTIPLLRRGLLVGWFRILTLILSDAALVLLAWRVAFWFGTPTMSPWMENGSFLVLILAIHLGVIISWGLYQAGDARRDYIGIFKAVSLSQCLLLLVAFLYEPNHYVSRSVFLLSWVLSIVLVCLGRFSVEQMVNLTRGAGGVRYAAFLISDEDEADRNVRLIEQEQRYNLLGVVPAKALDLHQRQETFEQLKRLGITEAFVSWNAINRRLYICWRFHTAGITLRILPPAKDFVFPRSEICMIGGVPAFTFPTSAIIGGDYWLKRGFDFCFALTVLTLFSPLYLAIALAIKLDSPGPIFFRQTRIGLRGKPFKVWKFRTMVTNAEKLQAKLEQMNENKDGVLFKMKQDPRVTRIGHFLRRYSLDELPQIFNVLVGQMSFVGPRPLPVRDVEKFADHHFIRQEVLPGITGMWQVSGRSDIQNFEDVLDLDLNYINNWSLSFDLNIIFQTVWVVLGKKGAY